MMFPVIAGSRDWFCELAMKASDRSRAKKAGCAAAGFDFVEQ
jgi:hypothetical protein